jgi:hypothetical protein
VDARDIALGTTGKIHSFSPIELTKDWLFRLKFKIDVDQAVIYKVIDEIRRIELFRMEKREGKWEPYRYYYGYNLQYSIEFVHELQNLFYALCKEELTT